MEAWPVLILLITFTGSQCFAKIRRDTYLSAYMESHGQGALSPGEVYGAPSADYGAPAMGYNYGPPAEEPHAAPLNPLDPIHAKIVLVFKVLLKILIFKLIVKFIAIICVLFFLPKLSELGIAKEESRRLTNNVTSDEDDIRKTQFILNAISGESAKYCSADKSLPCALLRGVQQLDTRYPVHRLLKSFIKEENTRLRRDQNHS